MTRELIARPFRTGGSSSKSWEFIIPSPIVKKYGINESTNFVVDHGDYGIILYYAKIESKKGSIDLGVKNFGQEIPTIARDES